MGELNGPVSMLDVGVGFNQRLSTPGGTSYVLVKFREHYIQNQQG